MVLCNNHKDVHVLWVWSEVALSPKFFRPPLSEFSGSAPVFKMSNDLNLVQHLLISVKRQHVLLSGGIINVDGTKYEF